MLKPLRRVHDEEASTSAPSSGLVSHQTQNVLHRGGFLPGNTTLTMEAAGRNVGFYKRLLLLRRRHAERKEGRAATKVCTSWQETPRFHVTDRRFGPLALFSSVHLFPPGLFPKCTSGVKSIQQIWETFHLAHETFPNTACDFVTSGRRSLLPSFWDAKMCSHVLR